MKYLYCDLESSDISDQEYLYRFLDLYYQLEQDDWELVRNSSDGILIFSKERDYDIYYEDRINESGTD